MRTNAGFTLLEMMASVAILAIVAGMMFLLAGTLQAASLTQETKLTTQEEVRAGMEFIVRELRQAADATITGLPGGTLSYRIATDLDGNGSAVDAGGNLELSAVRTIQRDVADVNGDGQTLTQLVMIPTGGTARVVMNGLAVNEDGNNNGALDAAEDRNFNGALDRGVWFERVGGGVRITLQSQRRAGPQGQWMTSTLVETVVPRN
jgi:prepilin-type N-terminal cleavage/methylation domain-containing protein